MTKSNNTNHKQPNKIFSPKELVCIISLTQHPKSNRPITNKFTKKPQDFSVMLNDFNRDSILGKKDEMQLINDDLNNLMNSLDSSSKSEAGQDTSLLNLLKDIPSKMPEETKKKISSSSNKNKDINISEVKAPKTSSKKTKAKTKPKEL